MPPIYFSKKRKKEMRARKWKLKQNMNDKDTHDGNDEMNPNYETQMAKQQQQQQQQQQEEGGDSQKPQNPATPTYIVHKNEAIINRKLIIRIPSGLDPQQTKKFRKDARRKARKRKEHPSSTSSSSNTMESSRSNFDNIVFLNDDDPIPEHLLPIPTNGSYDLTETTNTSTTTVTVTSSHPPPRKKIKKNFPCINDLIAADKIAKSKAEEKKKLELSYSLLSNEEKSKYIALDCEMVGVGAGGKQSALARVSLTNFDGDIILDSFVQVMDHVTDFRTSISGVRAKDIKVRKNKDAMEFKECRKAVGSILLDKILVGHAVGNDLKVLIMDHPKQDIRDTARFPDFMKATGKNGGKLRPRKLRDLAKEKLDLDIQLEGEAHSSVDDARAAMELYKSVRSKWEKQITDNGKQFGGRKM